jgi:hypothetical protein
MEMANDTTSGSGRSTRDGGLGSVLRVHIELWLVVVFMALAFGAGIVVTALYQQPEQQSIVGVPTGQVTLAPPLTDSQIQQGLPSGHPDINGTTGGGSEGNSGNGGNGNGGNGNGDNGNGSSGG